MSYVLVANRPIECLNWIKLEFFIKSSWYLCFSDDKFKNVCKLFSNLNNLF